MSSIFPLCIMKNNHLITMFNCSSKKINFLGCEKKMILKGPVCIPGIPDHSGDILTEETIRKAALLFNRQVNLIDVQHTLQSIGNLLESYISDTEIKFMGNTYPKGTWWISVDVTKPEIQEAIRQKEYTGFSILSAPYKSVDDMKRKGV